MIAAGKRRSLSTGPVGAPHSSNLLKFVSQAPKEVGIKCFPKQTYGISRDAPEFFKSLNTLTPEQGY